MTTREKGLLRCRRDQALQHHSCSPGTVKHCRIRHRQVFGAFAEVRQDPGSIRDPCNEQKCATTIPGCSHNAASSVTAHGHAHLIGHKAYWAVAALRLSGRQTQAGSSTLLGHNSTMALMRKATIMLCGQVKEVHTHQVDLERSEMTLPCRDAQQLNMSRPYCVAQNKPAWRDRACATHN